MRIKSIIVSDMFCCVSLQSLKKRGFLLYCISINKPNTHCPVRPGSRVANSVRNFSLLTFLLSIFQSSGFDLKAASPYHHALLARGGAFYPPYRPGAAEDPGRVAKVATRESTGALKAWLNEHLKNPYPTKGEKIMLAIITKMSLTQVSTWFANARRRLKKENRVSWACKGKSDEEDEEQDGESDDDDVSLQKCHLDEPQTERADEQVESALDGAAPVDARLEMQPSSEREDSRELALVKKVEKTDSDDAPSALESKENISSQKPKIWSLAETATSETVKKPLDSFYHPAGKLWAEWASRNGLFVPSCYTTQHEIV